MHKLRTASALVALSTFVMGAAHSLPSGKHTPPSPLSDEQAMATAKQVLAHADSNHDGRISRAEVLAIGMTKGRNILIEKRWKIADRNHDGYLSLDEIAATVKYISEERAKQKNRG